MAEHEDEHKEAEVSDVQEESIASDSEEPINKFQIVVPDPPEVIVLPERFVTIKVDDLYLRHKQSKNLALCKVRPPIVPPVKRDITVEPRERPLRVTKNFKFTDFTFGMESCMVINKAMDGDNVREGLHVDFSIVAENNLQLLCARGISPGKADIILDPLLDGSEWRLLAVGKDTYLMESVQYSGWVMAVNRFGLHLEKMSQRDWVRLERGQIHKHRKVTVTTIPDFAVRAPGVYVN
nr:hypothetical protein BaRGS_026052 [Batillaria attramentaria]